MTVKDKKVKVYLRKIRKMIPSGKAKEQILEQIHQSVEAYLEENPGADWDAFQDRFGTPEQISASYIEGMEPEEILGKFKKKKIIVGVVVGAVVLAILLWAVCLVVALNQNDKQVNGYYEADAVVEFDVNETEEVK